MEKNNVIILLISSVFGAFWRRWLGTSTKESRIFKILALYSFVLILYVLFDLLHKNWYSWFCFAWVSTWFMLFWNISHGDYFCVNDTDVDESRLKWVDWCLKKIYGEENYYNFKGNVTGMWIRYTVPAIFCSIFMPFHWFWIAGTFVSFLYGLCGKLFPKKPYTEYAEYLSGFTSFFWFALCLI